MNMSMKGEIDAASTIRPNKKPGLRTWVRDLEQAGQLRRIGALVDGNEEIGALARINLSMGGPALLFENIKDYEAGRCTKFFTCGMSNRNQVLLMLGLPKDTSDAQIVRHLKRAYRNPVP